MHIDFYFTPACPHADEAWTLLQNIVSELDIPEARIRRTSYNSFQEAMHHKIFGSPSIHINGRDIEGPLGEPSVSCRIYEGGVGIPPRWLIEAALLRELKPQGVLFLCVANSARSQLAEGIARRTAPSDVRIFSAGSQPTSPRPEAMQVLRAMGIDTSSHVSKHVDSIDPALVDTVITLCAEEACPLFLGRARRIHWGLPDPAAVEGNPTEKLNAFFKTAAELQKRIEAIWKSDTEYIRENVSDFYTQAVNTCSSCTSASACCSNTPNTFSSCCSTDTSFHDPENVSSWGCKNPVEAAALAAGETVLDVGCGAGHDLIAASRFTGPSGKLVGLDMTEAMLSAAHKYLQDAGIENFMFVKGEMEKMPLPDALADCIISNCVINLSPEKNRVFSEMFRVLKPGGRLVFADICVDELPAWVRNSVKAVSGCIGGAENVDTILEYMHQAGFENPRVLELTNYPIAQIRDMLHHTFDVSDDNCDDCASSPLPTAFRDRLASMLSGHLFSVLFFAHKP